jgi:hypothetical protein
MERVSQRLDQAASSVAHKNLETAYADGINGTMILAEVIAALELLYAQEVNPSDLALETVPKAYEELVSDYLRKLSYVE